jgi:hypothetical protein
LAEEASGGHLSAASAVVRNPLSVIAMFVLLVEAIATVTLVTWPKWITSRSRWSGSSSASRR